MDDYVELSRVLTEVPSADPAKSIWETLVPVRRMVHLDGRGWIPLEGLYTLRSNGLTRRERFELALAKRRSPLLAAELRTRPVVLARQAAQMSPAAWVRVLANTARVGSATAFPGSTDNYLIDPWTAHLRRSGVSLATDTSITGVRQGVGGAEVRHSDTWHRFDAVVVTAFQPDAEHLLDKSRLRHTLQVNEHALHNSASVTLFVDATEDVSARHEGSDATVFLYTGGGFYALYQPTLRRVVAVSLRSGVDSLALLDATRRLLRLRSDPKIVTLRDNTTPDSRLFGGTPKSPDHIAAAPDIHFAGSYLSRSYPLDSGEAAARSAVRAAAAVVSRQRGSSDFSGV